VAGPSNTCEFVVGRLLEIRVAAGYRTVADIDEMIERIGASARRLDPGVKFTIVADWRAVQIMSPETATRAQEMLAMVNTRVTRSGILTLPANPPTNLQVVRLVHEAQNANRQHFTSPIAMQRWLSEVLSAEESARLAAFLGIGTAAA
jgi:hypothetical protein